MVALKPMRPSTTTIRLEWWPIAMGEAASSGSSGDLRYACVPQARRLPIEQQGRLTLYDTGDHQFCGVLEGHGADGASPP
jgi:hypothetical protein